MKLSEQLKQDHECGDFGKALEGYSDKAKKLEDVIIELADTLGDEDSYSCSPEGRAYLEKMRAVLNE